MVAAQFWLLAMSSFGVSPTNLLPALVSISVGADASRADTLQLHPTYVSALFGLLNDIRLTGRCHFSWAVAFARVLQTGWASYTLWRTYDVQFRYNTLIVDPPTPCHFDVLPQYFSTRVALQIPELVLNVTALISTSLLAWNIVKGYRTSTIRRVMPPPGVMRRYKVGVGLSSPSEDSQKLIGMSDSSSWSTACLPSFRSSLHSLRLPSGLTNW